MVKDILDMTPLLFECRQAFLYRPDVDVPALVPLFYRLLQYPQQQTDDATTTLIFEGQMRVGDGLGEGAVPCLLLRQLELETQHGTPHL